MEITYDNSGLPLDPILQDEPRLFSTRDIYLASVLITCGIPLANIDYTVEGRESKRIGIFVFLDTPEARKIESDYFNVEDFKVDIKKYTQNFKTLKSRTNNNYKQLPY